MRNALTVLFLLGTTTFAFSQNHKLDSLDQLYKLAPSDTKRLELMRDMVDAGSNIDFATALPYAKRGVALAEKSGVKEWQPKFYEMEGRIYANLSQLDSAMIFFDKALIGYVAIDNKKGQATTLFKIAWVSRHRGELNLAMESDLKGLRLMEELNDQVGIASALGRLSDDMNMQGQQPQALEYAQRAIEICEKNKLEDELPYALRNAGDVAIAMYDHEKAFAYYDRALKLVLPSGQETYDVADLSNCRGNALKRLGRYDEALKDYQTCYAISEKLNYAGGISTSIANLGEVNLLKGNYKEALPFQLRTIELQEKEGDLSNLTENYGHASTIYEKLGDYKLALLYQKKARLMRDSTASEKSDQAISALRTQYETEKKDATISVQQAKLNLQHFLQWLYIGIAALLALFALVLYRNSITRKQTNKLLTTKNAENELLLKEIHHRVKNNLEVVSSLLALQSAQVNDPSIRDAMQEGQNRVQSIGIVHQKLYQGTNLAAVEMKDYFINLSESILESFGAENRVTIECAMNNLELDIDTAVPLGLITNEILTNALKYAFPDGRKGKIEINLAQKDEHTFQLKIADNGIGKSGAVHGTGFGGQLVSLLTRQLSGSMREEVKNGTAIYIEFVMKKIA